MKAFIVVDVQNDFCPGGTLAVPDGDRVVPVINALRRDFALTVFTQDWHPRDHASFASNNPGTRPGEVIRQGALQQVMWPDHCVQDTPGAALRTDLDVRPEDPVFRKGQLRAVDSYSGFLDNDQRHETGLRRFLHERGVDQVYLAGLATDYCVKFTALDARKFGFRTHVYRAGCRAVNLHPDDEAQAWREMEQAGVVLLP